MSNSALNFNLVSLSTLNSQFSSIHSTSTIPLTLQASFVLNNLKSELTNCSCIVITAAISTLIESVPHPHLSTILTIVQTKNHLKNRHYI